MPMPSISGATAAATTSAFSRRVSVVGRPAGETEASSHPAKKWVTGLIGSKAIALIAQQSWQKFCLSLLRSITEQVLPRLRNDPEQNCCTATKTMRDCAMR